MRLALLSALNAERAARRPAVVVTDLQTGEGRLLLAKDLVDVDPTDLPAVAAVDALRTGRSQRLEIDGNAWFLAVHAPPMRLVVVGAVHISQAMVPMATALGIDLTVIDPRTAFATPERFPGVRLVPSWPDEALPGLGVDPYTAFATLTHDPKIDEPALLHALAAGCFYVGALGSRKTHAARVARLASQGVDERDLARLRAPIGLDIGAVSPAEIALAILGEVIAAHRKERVS